MEPIRDIIVQTLDGKKREFKGTGIKLLPDDGLQIMEGDNDLVTYSGEQWSAVTVWKNQLV